MTNLVTGPIQNTCDNEPYPRLKVSNSIIGKLTSSMICFLTAGRLCCSPRERSVRGGVTSRLLPLACSAVAGRLLLPALLAAAMLLPDASAATGSGLMAAGMLLTDDRCERGADGLSFMP